MKQNNCQHRPLLRQQRSRPTNTVRVGLWLPVWCCGGVERYHLDLARATGPKIKWVGCCLHPYAETIPEMVEELSRVMPVTRDIDALAAECDIILTWCITDLKPVTSFPGRVIIIQHGDTEWAGQWYKEAMDSLERPIEAVAVSTTSRDICKEIAGVDATILRGGVDMNRIYPTRPRWESRKLLGLSDDDYCIGYVGRYSIEKNPLMAAKVVGHFNDKFLPKAVYHGHAKSGEDQFRADVEEASKGRCVFADRTWHTGDVYSVLDCLIVASPKDAGPLVAVEAWLTGVPLISSNVGLVGQFCQSTIVEDCNDVDEYVKAVVWHYNMRGSTQWADQIQTAAGWFSAAAAARRWESFLCQGVDSTNQN